MKKFIIMLMEDISVAIDLSKPGSDRKINELKCKGFIVVFEKIEALDENDALKKAINLSDDSGINDGYESKYQSALKFVHITYRFGLCACIIGFCVVLSSFGFVTSDYNNYNFSEVIITARTGGIIVGFGLFFIILSLILDAVSSRANHSFKMYKNTIINF